MLDGAAGQVILPPGHKFDGLVAEILGHFGSSEGYVKILRDIGVNYRQELLPLKAVVPAAFGTAVVPVSLCTMKEKFTVMCLGPKVALVKNFPFRSASLSASRVPPKPGAKGDNWGVAHELPSGHGFMELYDSKDIISHSHLPPADFTFDTEWVVHHEGCLDALATYLLYGDSVEGPFWTSNQDGDVTYTNWATALLPLPFTQNMFTCFVGDRILLRSVCKLLLEAAPSYHFRVTVLDSFGRVRIEKELEVEYKDLVCRLVPLREVVRRGQQKGAKK